ncbi:Ribonuclease R [wastewater metagenome]|uniref:exoribonuclease II n=2 Tax=unclassified sequences TaxID=12908 RepID=A0A5B8R9J9_9ZZZZ|nr:MULTISPECIES: ribonuclease R [Arhodomonas]MCS4505153.1 ribonuclease R [Arhodomonas aquaeolei]QEA05420.1 ribonuclease R [uncultured organism]
MAKKRSVDPDTDPHLAREKEKYGNPVPSREFILEQLEAAARPLSRRELAELFELAEEDDLEGLRRRLRAMERDGQLVRNRRNGYVVVDNEELVRGRVRSGPEGWGMLHPDLPGDDVLLSPREMRNLLHGDRAVARITGVDRQGRTEGEIVEVLERANRSIAGRYFEESGVGFLVPDNKRLHQDVIIPADNRGEAQNGDLVVVEVLSQPTKRRQPIGRVTEVVGRHIPAGSEIDVAARVHGIPVEWPAEVTRDAEAFGDEVPGPAKQGRTDLRQLPLVTIDGPDARDYDDAVYCEPTDSGWKLLVAIADVAHYVEPGSALDREAAERGNSVYFPRSVVPMLPEVLSNGLCSLNPKVDRLCMVCEMQISREGKLRRSRFYEGVMRSSARLTYDEVKAIHIDRDPDVRRRFRGVLKHVDNLFSVYRALRKDRDRRGAIDFETTETEMSFDDQGQIAGIHPTERHDAHKLIEECMVRANVAAARFLLRRRIPALYRVHERPAEERLTNLRQFLSQTGLRLEGGDAPEPKDYARLMQRVRSRPDRHLIETVLLRSMMAAEYRPDNVGHFGLALDAYAHFTSPIRRYPDLVVHRAIKHAINGGKPADFGYRHDYLVTLGEHCSMTDRRAEEASRDAEMTLKCRYMSQHVGTEFNGVISGVTSFGLFVELDGVYVDGLIHITNLESDFFHFDPIGHRLTGQRTGKEYRLTDRIRVLVARVDIDERKIDFQPVAHPLGPDGEPLEESAVRRRGGGQKKQKSRSGRRRGGRRRSSGGSGSGGGGS